MRAVDMKMTNIALKIIHDLQDLFIPDYCLACNDSINKNSSYLCSRCWAGLTVYPDRSGYPFRSLRSVLDRLWIAWDYDDTIRLIIHNFKYKLRPDLADLLVDEWLQIIRHEELKMDVDMLVPVPIHSARLRMRGFNQSGLIASSLAARFNLPVETDNAIRNVNTPSQTKLDIGKRWRSVANAFEIRHPAVFRNRKVLIIDDLVTSGATLHSLALQIRNCNAASVSAAALTSPCGEGQAI